jgi:ATP-dependent RNA helicase DDX55/SPB4
MQIELNKKEKKNRTRRDKKEAKVRNTMKDWDDLAEDQRLFKKFKKGKISKEEYDKLMWKNI